MAEQAVWRVRRISLSIPAPSLSAIRSRLWMLAPPLLLGLLAALLAPRVERGTYRAKAEVLFNHAQLPTYYFPNPALLSDQRPASPFLLAQAQVARSPELARRVVAAAGVPGIRAAWFLRHSKAEPQADSGQLLTNSARVLQLADGATKIRPYALRNGILGGVIGALFGLALVVFLRRARRKPRGT